MLHHTEKIIFAFICKSKLYSRLELTHANSKVELTHANRALFLSAYFVYTANEVSGKEKALGAPLAKRTHQSPSKDMPIISLCDVERNTENHPF